MRRRAWLQATWRSVLQGVYLSALILALVALGLRVAQGIEAVRAGCVTPAEAIEAVEAWLGGE